jgi:nicotinate-nucleotide--dimethylbenzimidazole phosphoribosyltransferase
MEPFFRDKGIWAIAPFLTDAACVIQKGFFYLFFPRQTGGNGMNVLTATIGGIGTLNEAIMENCQQRLDALTKPAGSLAVLENMAGQLAGIRGKVCLPPPRKAIVLMAADHGVADEGVSAFPSEVTAQMVLNFVNGGAAINVLARHADARLVLVDVGIKSPLPPDLPIQHRRIRSGTANMRFEAAMIRQEAIRAIETGIQVANELADEGVEAIALGEMGIGNTTASSAITTVLTTLPVSKVVGKGTGIAPECVAHKIKVIHEAIRLNRPDPRDAVDVLAKVGGLEIAALAGVALGAARRRMVVMLDGFIASAAVLAAYRLSEKVKPFLMASHLSEEPGHAVILKELGLQPCLRLNMRLGEGSGAALGLTLLDAAAKIVNEMATFEEARVASSVQQECKTVVNQ